MLFRSGYEFNIVPCFETTHVLSCRSTTLLMSSSEKKRTHSLWEQSNGSTHEAMEKKMGNIFPFQDDSFLMSTSQLKEELLPVVDLEPYWLCRAIGENKRTNSLCDQSNGSFIHEEMEEKMIDGRHLEVRNIFSFLDDTFSMNISHLKEKLIPTKNP